MKWEHVYKVLDPKTAVREVHIAIGDKELVMTETPDGRRETYEIDAKGATYYLPNADRRPNGACYTKVAPFDCTPEYCGDGRGMSVD